MWLNNERLPQWLYLMLTCAQKPHFLRVVGSNVNGQYYFEELTFRLFKGRQNSEECLQLLGSECSAQVNKSARSSTMLVRGNLSRLSQVVGVWSNVLQKLLLVSLPFICWLPSRSLHMSLQIVLLVVSTHGRPPRGSCAAARASAKLQVARSRAFLRGQNTLTSGACHSYLGLLWTTGSLWTQAMLMNGNLLGWKHLLTENNSFGVQVAAVRDEIWRRC